jgi:hypothetical protein
VMTMVTMAHQLPMRAEVAGKDQELMHQQTN